ncbi:hypothetical protein LT493_39715 [Streptomyces tricolor]|nr:hypothetical protein [Streptomyces tricolor]
MHRFGNARVIFGGPLLAALSYALFLPVGSRLRTYRPCFPPCSLLGIAFSLAYGPSPHRRHRGRPGGRSSSPAWRTAPHLLPSFGAALGPLGQYPVNVPGHRVDITGRAARRLPGGPVGSPRRGPARHADRRPRIARAGFGGHAGVAASGVPADLGRRRTPPASH